MRDPGPRLYHELASWWPLVSPPSDYEEEAALYRRLIVEHARRRVVSVLELGSGGGNTASHLKTHFRMTLVDRSPAMLAVCREANPECETLEGDMREVRIGRRFDAVFVHDALTLLASREDLRRTLETCAAHCEAGGVVLLVPDYVRETFRPDATCDGHDEEERGLRYLEWTHDPDPHDERYTVDYAFLLRDRDGGVRAVHDRHVCGLFPRAVWMSLLEQAGFRSRRIAIEPGRLAAHALDLFVGRMPGG